MSNITLHDGTANRTFMGLGAVRSPRNASQQLPSSEKKKKGKTVVTPGAVVIRTIGTNVVSTFKEIASGELVTRGAKLVVSHFIPEVNTQTASTDVTVELPVYVAATTTSKAISEKVSGSLSVRHPLQGDAANKSDYVKVVTMLIDYYTSGNPTLDLAADGRVEDAYLKKDPD